MITRLLFSVLFCLTASFSTQAYFQDNYQLELQIENEENKDVGFIVFAEEGVNGTDIYDAFKLANLAGSYAELYTQDADTNNLSINVLPIDLDEVLEIPIYFRSTYADTFKLSVKTFKDFPQNWTLSLIDTAKTDTLLLNASSSIDTVIHEGTFVSGLLTVKHFTLLINPGIEVQNISITGTPGKNSWQLLGSAFSNLSYGTLLNSVWTQGGAGSNDPSGTSNIYTWSELNQQFESITDFNIVPEQGTGYVAYLFEDDDGTTEAVDGGWPKVFQTKGITGFGTISIPVTYSTGADNLLNGYNLVANPYTFSIDWEANSGWTKTNIDNSLWIWDSNSNNGDGNYLVYIDGVGDNITTIAPFQAFWVRANAPNPLLSISENVESASGNLFKSRKSVSQFSISVSLDGKEDQHYISFREYSKYGIDPWDVAKLPSLSENFISVHSQINNRTLAIQSFPSDEEEFEIPLYVASSAYDTAILKLQNLDKLLDSYIFELFDHETKQSIYLDESTNFSYEFSKANETHTFTLYLTKTTSVGVETETPTPSHVELHQNYPNPFNPITLIRYQTPRYGNVELKVFDMLGRQVTTLVNEPQAAGFYQVHFDASSLASGVYLYQLRMENSVITKKFTLVK